MHRFIIGLLLASMAGPLLAEKPKTAREKQDEDPNKVVCRYSEEIGTRLAKKKTCLTRSQWDQYEREMRNQVQRVQDMKPHTGD